MNERALLSELNELKDGPVYKLLCQLRDEAVEKWTNSTDDRSALLLQGEKRRLDNLIGRIDSARKEYLEAREREARPKMSKVF